MSELRPFRGLRFARDPGPRIAPPYDVIDDQMRAALAEEPENVVHLTLPPGGSGERDYGRARRALELLIRRGALRRDPEPELYVLEERTPDGRTRRGFLGLLRLADYAERIVLPHERTMAGPKLDRLRLTRAVRANLEPVFFLYEDRQSQLDPVLARALELPALATCPGPGGVGLSLHAVDGVGAQEAVRDFLAELPLIIADGHHRYETMLRYRDECRESDTGAGRDAPHEFVLAYVVNAFDPGSSVRPIHRLIARPETPAQTALAACGFQSWPVDATPTPQGIEDLLAKRARDEHAFVLAQRGDFRLATRSRGEALDVDVLHEELLPRLGGDLSFDANPERIMRSIASGAVELALMMNPLPTEDLFRVVSAGRVLPQKSTYFSPKIPSGLVIRDF